MWETGNDGDVIINVFYIWSQTVFSAHSSEQMDENWTERQLGQRKFDYGFAQNLVQDSPKQAKNEIIQEIASFQLVPLFILRFACLVVRLCDWNENRESHDKIIKFKTEAFNWNSLQHVKWYKGANSVIEYNIIQ